MLTQKYTVVVGFVIILVAGLAAWTFIGVQALESAPAPGNAEVPQGLEAAPLAPAAHSRPSGGDFMISRLSENQSEQKIAYNPDDDEYLVVWSAYRGVSSNDILGQLYSAQGVPRGTQFVICSRQYYQGSPSVAYNTTRHEYLVIWDDYSVGGGDADIYGQRISRGGALVLGDFPIAASAATSYNGAMAYNPAADEYLVIWSDTRNGGTDIYGRRVDGDGVLLGSSDLEIALGANDQWAPDIAYNNDLDEYMVLWTEIIPPLYDRDVRGQRIDADGTLIGGNLLILVSTTNADQNPALVYNPVRHRYLLVWGSDSNDPIQGLVYAAWMQGNGALETTLLLASSAWAGYPASVCVDTASGQSLVVWMDTRNSPRPYENDDIYAARLLADGSLAPQGNFAISTADARQLTPVTACSSVSHQFMVIFQDQRDPTRNRLFGQRVWWPGHLLGNEFAVGLPDLAAFYPAVAFDERENRFLVVWQDDRNGDDDIFGQLFDRNGRPIEENFPISQGDGSQGRPAVAYNAASMSYLVVWEDGLDHTVRGQLVSPQGSLAYNRMIISSVVLTSTQPAVAANPASNNFLVVFEQEGSGTDGKDVGARLVKPDGSMVSYGITLSNATGSQGMPAVVYNPNSSEYLVVWQDARSGTYQIYGQRVGPSYQMLGANFQVSTGGVMEQAPALVHNPDDNQYLVTWHRNQSAAGQGTDIFAQRLAANGSALGSNFQVSTVTGDSDQMFAAVIYFSALDRYGIIWADGRDPVTQTDLRGQWLSNTGAVLGSYDLPIFRGPGVQSNPAIIYAPGYDQALTVWYDNSLPNVYSIHGRLGALDSTPPAARFTVDETFGYAGQTYVLNAWPSRDDITPRGLLMVRWDLNSDGAWDTDMGFDKYITRTIATAGIYTVTLEVTDQGWLTDTMKRRIFVFPAPQGQAAAPEQPNTPTPGLAVTPTLATAGSTFSFDGQASTGSGILWGRWDFENDGIFDTDFSTTLSVTHVYTQAGEHTVRLEVRDDSQTSKSAIVNLTVIPATLTSLEISPSELQVIPGEVVRLRLTASDVYGNEVFNPVGVTWSLLTPPAGSVDACGVFTASLQAGSYTNAVQAGLGGLTDAISIKIYGPFEAYLPLIQKQHFGP